MQAQASAILSISEINRLARLALEKGLPSCWVRGELSNMTRASSGHWYFTIKDASASARCVMFRPRNQFVDWPARDGDHIEIRAQASLYEPRGDFQLIVESMRRAGLGDLYEAFIRLKAKLQQEGLFDPERKKSIPAMPRAIGIVTSAQAAALRDVLTTLKVHWPLATVVIYPCLVQGETAPLQIQQAIHRANQRSEVDTLLLVRGGGSLEDLRAFNDEEVARAIASSSIPIITGVGHETDFTIADFVADLRAPTPTGAAQMAAPDQQDVSRRSMLLGARCAHHLRSRLDASWQLNDSLHKRLRHPKERLHHQGVELLHLTHRLAHAGRRLREIQYARLSRLESRLIHAKPLVENPLERMNYLRRRLLQSAQHQYALRQKQLMSFQTQLSLLCPNLVLRRGYSIVRTPAGVVVMSATDVYEGQRLSVELAHGQLGVEVKEKV